MPYIYGPIYRGQYLFAYIIVISALISRKEKSEIWLKKIQQNKSFLPKDFF